MGKSSSRVHECRCERWPDCVLHSAKEWGGDEPDICETHEHLEAALTAEEAMARRVIAAAMEGFDPDAQERIVAGVRQSLLEVVR